MMGKKSIRLIVPVVIKTDRTGDEPIYPSLIDLKKRMSEDEALNKIKQGSGKMPSFAGILKGHEDGIIDYLFEKTDKRLLQKETDLSEIRNNRLSNIEVKEEKATVDTATTYLNVTAYAQLKDPEGRPAIKPPWGTLNAINLNTGEYEWTIPVGNNPELQKKGEPITGATGLPGPIVTRGGLVFLGGSRIANSRLLIKLPVNCYGKQHFRVLHHLLPARTRVMENNMSQYQLQEIKNNRQDL